MKKVIIIIQELLYSLWDILLKQMGKLKALVLAAGIFDKGIMIASFLGLFAVIMSVGQYYIFETWFYINNPLAVYLIAIVIYMLVTVRYKHRWYAYVRIGLNLYYLAWVFIVHFAIGIIKAPYDLNFGYFLNIAVPIIFAILSLLEFFNIKGKPEFQR